MHVPRALVVSSLLWFAASTFAAEPIRPADLAARLGTADAPLVIDTRTPEEFGAGHVPGAVLVPHDAIETHLLRIAADREIVLYCRSGRRSALAEAALRDHGFTNLRQLEGSWLAWEAAGLPAATSSAADGVDTHREDQQ